MPEGVVKEKKVFHLPQNAKDQIVHYSSVMRDVESKLKTFVSGLAMAAGFDGMYVFNEEKMTIEEKKEEKKEPDKKEK